MSLPRKWKSVICHKTSLSQAYPKTRLYPTGNSLSFTLIAPLLHTMSIGAVGVGITLAPTENGSSPVASKNAPETESYKPATESDFLTAGIPSNNNSFVLLSYIWQPYILPINLYEPIPNKVSVLFDLVLLLVYTAVSSPSVIVAVL